MSMILIYDHYSLAMMLFWYARRGSEMKQINQLYSVGEISCKTHFIVDLKFKAPNKQAVLY